MFNTNWPLNSNKSTSNVDWSALADTWMQQREQQQQQVQWQQAPPLPLPPQFLIGAPPIPPPGPMPIGMTFPPLPPTQLGLAQHHHQLQVGSNTAQESLTMTNIENSSWRPPLPPPPPPPPPSLLMSSGPQWRPNMNNSQPLFPIQSEIAPSFGGRNFWPPGGTGPQVLPPPIPPPVPPPLPPQQPQIPPQFPAASYQHSPVDKRMMNTSFNTSIPSLMDLPSSYKQKPVPPPIPIPPASVLPLDPTIIGNVPNIVSGNNTNSNAKRRKIPAWLREELGRIEREKEKKMFNTSTNSNNNTNHSMNNTFSKFDDDDDEDEESTTRFDDDDDDDKNDEEHEQEDEEEPNSTQISSTPIVNRRTRFDDDKSTDSPLNVSAISKRTHPTSPSPPSTTLIDDDPIDREEQLMNKLRRALTELLLEVTNEELVSIAKEVHLSCKMESSTPVIRKASGLSSLIQSFSGTDSDDEEEKNIQTIVKTTVITKSSIQPPPIKSDNDKSLSKSSTKPTDTNSKSKKKKSTRDRSPSKKHHHHKKHRHSSSSSSSSSTSNSPQTHSQKKTKSSDHNSSYSEHNKSKKYDDRGRKH